MSDAAALLLLVRFPAGARLEGAIAGAIERMQVTGEPRLLDAVLVTRDVESGDLAALDLATGLGHGTMVALLDFRLGGQRRRELTERTLAAHPGGVPPVLVTGIGERLAAGEAALAALVTAGEPLELTDAVARAGGRVLARGPVDAARLADVSEHLLVDIGTR